ncbi:S8 family serine peptidase [Actinoplanes sp. CA-252034]|uniref:S8 family serine peptidase n=1 Tax=Actinoplanes sp. CA-252034 TaxID=3239906 RepID=UPI003D96E27A
MALCAATPAKADQIRSAQWHLEFLHISEVHRITTGSGSSVAVVDTGVSPHVDFSRNLQKGTNTGPGGDETGRVDENGHGTMMAGIIGAHGHGSGAGIMGIAPNARVIPVKTAAKISNGLGIPAGIKWAATSGANVINVSGSVAISRELNESIAAALGSDAVVVAATGNRSDDPEVALPAALPDVLAVGATDQNGRLANFSVTGPEVDICAPGVDIVTTDRNNKYAKGRGTSQATAIVSGAAALVRARFTELSAPEVIHRLTATADDNGPPGRDNQCGYGVLNIVKALTADVPPLHPSGGAASTAPSGAPSARTSTSSGGATSNEMAAPDPARSNLLLVTGIGAVVVAVGTVAALLVRRRRRISS